MSGLFASWSRVRGDARSYGANVQYNQITTHMLIRMDFYRNFRQAGLGDSVSMEGGAGGGDTPDPNCPNDGRLCLCTKGYNAGPLTADGVSFHTADSYLPGDGSTCQPWKFQVGDVICEEKPAERRPEFAMAYTLAKVTGSPNVHSGIVAEVPPDGVAQTADNIFIVEALKGSVKQVMKTSFRTVVNRFPFGGFSIRRVDAGRFPGFFTAAKQQNVTKWLESMVGLPFDTEMVNPMTRHWNTGGRYINPNPGCGERERALAMYNSGGPGQFLCSSLAAWAMAYPGGLNTDYDDPSDGCDTPTWRLYNLQPDPGQLLRMDVYDPKYVWHIPCNIEGCYVGVPQAGGQSQASNSPSSAPTSAPESAPSSAPVGTRPATSPRPPSTPRPGVTLSLINSTVPPSASH